MLEDSLNDSSLRVVVEASSTGKVGAASTNREDLTTTTRPEKSRHTRTTIATAVSTGPSPSKAIKTGRKPKSRMVHTTTSSGMPELTGRGRQTAEKAINTKQPVRNSKRRKEKKHTETYMAMSIKVQVVPLPTFHTCV